MSIPQSIDECMTLISLTSIDPEDRDCSICRMPMEDAEDPHDDMDDQHKSAKLVICGHIFGESCIVQWLQVSTTCPLCRILVYSEPDAESDSDDESATPAVQNPIWAYRVRPETIQTLESLFDDETLCAAIIRRALDLIQENTTEAEFPLNAWFWMTFRLADMTRQLAAEGWEAYIQWLVKDVLPEWEDWRRRYWWLTREEYEEFSWLEDEAQPMIDAIKREVERCREIVGWDALPGCQFGWL